MKTYNLKNKPIGVLLIAAFYVFGALMLLVSIFINPVETSQTIAAAHGLSPIVGVEVLVIIAAFALVLAYGLIRLSRWGYILGIAYSLYLVGVSLVMGGLGFMGSGQANVPLYLGNFLWSMLVVIYLFFVRRSFFNV